MGCLRPTRRQVERYEAEWAAIDRHDRRGEGLAEYQAWRREREEEQQEKEREQEQGRQQGWDQRGEGCQQQEGARAHSAAEAGGEGRQRASWAGDQRDGDQRETWERQRWGQEEQQSQQHQPCTVLVPA